MLFLFLLLLLSLLLTLKLRLDFGAAAVESDPADVQALCQELAQAQAALEEHVTCAELQDSVQEAVEEARQVIARLEAENAQLVQVRGQLHEQVQTALRTQQALFERLTNSAVEHRRLHQEEQWRMTDEHAAELARLTAAHKAEMEEVLKQACDARDARDADKERLDGELIKLRRIMADNDATLIRNIGRLHDQLRGNLFLELVIFQCVRPGLIVFPLEFRCFPTC